MTSGLCYERASYFESCHNPFMNQMLVNNLVNVATVSVGVPRALRINHDYRPFLAAIETTGAVHADTALSMQPQRFDPLLGVIAHDLGIVVRAAGGTVIPTVHTKKHMVTIVVRRRHGSFLTRRG